MFLTFFVILGLIVGSFLNVVVLRHGARTVGGRSACMSCGVQLRWYDMIPAFSWVILHGKCRNCDSNISIQYPLVEALTALLFMSVGLSSIPIILIPFALVIVSFFIVIAVYDIRHTIIPDIWVWTLNAFAFLWGISSLLLVQSHYAWWWIILGGPAVALPLFLLWVVSHGRWMGFGDVKLALAMGWLLGPMIGLYALMASFVIGAVVSVCILLPLPQIMRAFRVVSNESTHFSMKSEIPFGPFMIVATLIVWFAILYGINLPFFYI